MQRQFFLNFLKFLLFLGVGVGILYLVYLNQNAAYTEDCALKGIAPENCSLLQKVWTDFKSVDYFWILLVLIAFTLSNVSRALRWNMLLRSLGYRPTFTNAFLTTFIGYFANLGLPRMGEIVRPGMMARYEKMKVEKVIGTVVLERMVDVVTILIVTATAVLVEFDNIAGFFLEYADLSEKLGGPLALLPYLLTPIAVFGALFWFFRRKIMESSLFKKIKELATGFWHGLQSIKDVKQPGLFVFHSLSIWILYYAMTYFCFLSFMPTANLSMIAALVVFVFGGWGIVIPSPGGMGTYHFLAQTALAMYGVSGDDGFSWANISFFSIQIGCNVLIGIIALALLPVVNKNYQPQHLTTDGAND